MALATARLINLDTREALFFQFHPQTLRETIEVDYGLEMPIGGSREVSHYNGTRSTRIPLRLTYTEIRGLGDFAGSPFTRISSGQTRAVELQQKNKAGDSVSRRPGDSELGPAAQSVAGAERFLKALCYGTPRSFAGDHETRGKRRLQPPARVLFIWPEVLQLEGEIDRVSVTFDRFEAGTLRPLSLIADVDFRETSPDPIEAAKVRKVGSRRPTEGIGGMPPRQINFAGGRRVKIAQSFATNALSFR